LSKWTRRVALMDADGCGATVLTCASSFGKAPLDRIRR
jgi:hypothetical protein